MYEPVFDRVPQEERRPGSRRRNGDGGPQGGTTTGSRAAISHTRDLAAVAMSLERRQGVRPRYLLRGSSGSGEPFVERQHLGAALACSEENAAVGHFQPRLTTKAREGECGVH